MFRVAVLCCSSTFPLDFFPYVIGINQWAYVSILHNHNLHITNVPTCVAIIVRIGLCRQFCFLILSVSSDTEDSSRTSNTITTTITQF